MACVDVTKTYLNIVWVFVPYILEIRAPKKTPHDILMGKNWYHNAVLHPKDAG